MRGENYCFRCGKLFFELSSLAMLLHSIATCTQSIFQITVMFPLVLRVIFIFSFANFDLCLYI